MYSGVSVGFLPVSPTERARRWVTRLYSKACWGINGLGTLSVSVRGCPDGCRGPDGCRASISSRTGIKVCLHSHIASPTVRPKEVISNHTKVQKSSCSCSCTFFPATAYWGKRCYTWTIISCCWLILCFGTSWGKAAALWLITLTGLFFPLMLFFNPFWSDLFFCQLEYPVTTNVTLLCEILLPQIILSRIPYFWKGSVVEPYSSNLWCYRPHVCNTEAAVTSPLSDLFPRRWRPSAHSLFTGKLFLSFHHSWFFFTSVLPF